MIGESDKPYLAVMLNLSLRFIVGSAVSAVHARHVASWASHGAERCCPKWGAPTQIRAALRERRLSTAPRRSRHHRG